MNTTSANVNILKTNTYSKVQNSRNIAIVLLCIVFIIIVTLALKDNKSFYIDTLAYTVYILFTVFALFTFIVISMDDKSKSLIFFYLVVVTVIIISITLVHKSNISTLLSKDYFQNSVLLSIFLIALIITFYVFLEKYANQPGWTSFIIKFMFYIPCVITDGIKYLIEDVFSTKAYIFYLIIVEFILIAIYFYFYPRLKDSVYNNGVLLLKDPTPLNEEKRIDNELYKSFANKKPLPGSKIEIRSPNRNTYSLSMWIFLNNQSSSQYSYSKESTIFSYSDQDGNPHPKITYKNNENETDKFTIYFSLKKKYIFSLPHQKWNNIVLNFRDLNVDVFINAEFITSVKLQNLPNYTDRDIIVIGENGIDDRSGLYGSICNVVYYKDIMTQGQIIDNYNLLSIRNPPVN